MELEDWLLAQTLLKEANDSRKKIGHVVFKRKTLLKGKIEEHSLNEMKLVLYDYIDTIEFFLLK